MLGKGVGGWEFPSVSGCNVLSERLWEVMGFGKSFVVGKWGWGDGDMGFGWVVSEGDAKITGRMAWGFDLREVRGVFWFVSWGKWLTWVLLVSWKWGLESVASSFRNSSQVRTLKPELPALIQGPNLQGPRWKRCKGLLWWISDVHLLLACPSLPHPKQ